MTLSPAEVNGKGEGVACEKSGRNNSPSVRKISIINEFLKIQLGPKAHNMNTYKILKTGI